jgi:hypothetical protein
VPTVLLPIQPGNLPPASCFASEQARLNAFAEVMHAVLAGGLAFYNYGDTAPDPDLQGYPWLNTETGLWYTYSGSWRSPRPKCEQDPLYRILWVGAEANVPLKDGGTAGIPTEDTGPFWEIDTAFAGRSPMMPGEIPTSNPTKNLAVGEDFGEGAHTQLDTEVGVHNHAPSTGYGPFVAEKAGGTIELLGGTGHANMSFTAYGGGVDDGSGNRTTQAMPIIHPCRGIWLLKPTIRIWYTIP